MNINYFPRHLASLLLFLSLSLSNLHVFAENEFDYSNIEFETQISDLLQNTDRLYNSADNDYVEKQQELLALKLNGNISDEDKIEIDNYSDECTARVATIHEEYERIDNDYKAKAEEIYQQRVKIREECERGILDNYLNAKEIYNNWLTQKQQLNEQQLNDVNERNNRIKALISQFEALTREIQQKIASFTPSGIQHTTIINNDTPANIYSINGVSCKSGLMQLPQGIYIINGKKVLINQ